MSIKHALQRIGEIIQQVDTLGHNQTIEYPGGLSMIDLSRRSQPTPVHTGEALLWLADESLARVVGSLLNTRDSPWTGSPVQPTSPGGPATLAWR